MKLTLVRTKASPEADAIFGELRIEEELECLTLERMSTLIPPGLYPITFYLSPHNRLLVPLLTVPGREWIEIHPANYPAQLEGCIAVGTSHNQDSICNSRFAFSALMAKLDGMESVSIEILDQV